jgi:TctA family transporter
MLETAQSFLFGLTQIFTVTTFSLMLLGIAIGFAVGILPGLGGPTAMALMLPFVIKMTPVEAFAFLLSMASVVNTTGDITSVLFGIPGEPTTAAAICDGHPMAKKGQAGRALGAILTAALIGTTFGAFVLALAVPIVRPLVLSFGSPEFFMLSLLGITFVASLSGDDVVKGLLAGGMGLLIATIGLDAKSGVERFSFNVAYFWEGIDLVLIALGIFGIPEVIDLAGRKGAIAKAAEFGHGYLQGILDCFRHWWLLLRTSVIGAWVGFLPGLGSSVADWFAYAHAVQTEKNRENFGKGDVRGVIASEGSNNAKEGGDYIPTLAFGIPGGTSTALVLTAFVAVGIKPGPDMLTSQLNLTFAVIWTLVIANILATAICMLFAKPIAKVCFLPFYAIVPPIVAFIFIGAFAANFHSYDLTALMLFSLLGFFMRRHGWPRAPLVLGVVLGEKMELYLWLSYTRYGFEWLTRPMVIVLFVLLVASIVYPIMTGRKQRRDAENSLAEV